MNYWNYNISTEIVCDFYWKNIVFVTEKFIDDNICFFYF